LDIKISGRNTEITPALEQAVRTKIGSLDRYLDQLDTAEVHFDEARNSRIVNDKTCEVTIEGHGHHLRCKVNAPDVLVALDLAGAKLERQIRKLRTKLQLRYKGRGDTIRTAPAQVREVPREQLEHEASEVETADADPELRIVKTKRFHLGPLTPPEAALKMDLLGHGFFFFINSATGRSAVVYRRDNGAVGLIDEAG